MFTRRRALWVAGLVLAVVAVDEAWWQLRHPDFQRAAVALNEDGQSADVPADIKLMWETGTMDWVADPSHRANEASTDRAIHAASRVFNTVDLKGKTRAQVIARLGDPESANDSIYNFPFWPAPWGALVYRFDTGAYGWQFNIRFGWWGTVRAVDRLWIH